MAQTCKAGFVGLIGRPNVGKSTLMNTLVGQKIAITSKKPQTTRNRIRTVYTDPDRGQIVFTDTPGIHQAKNKLGEYMVREAEHVLGDADVLCWLVEPETKIGSGDRHILDELKRVDIPVFLVINKIDSVPGERVFEIIDTWRKEYDFAEILPVCARSGKGCAELIDTLYAYLPEGEPFFDEDTVTDQPMRQIAAEIIREKALHALDAEVPHGIAVAIDEMKEKQNGSWDIAATIICERDSHKGIIIGKKGGMLKKIGTNARYELEQMVEGHVNLQLWVKVKKDWRESDYLVRNFGYRDEKES